MIKHWKHIGAALALALSGHWAQAQYVAVVGANSPATPLTAEQLSNVFAMRLKALPGAGNATLVVVGSTKPQLLTLMGKTEDQAKALWVRQVFTGGGSPPADVPSATEVKKLLSNPNAVAIIEAAQVDASVKVICKL